MAAVIGTVEASILIRVGKSDVLNEIGTVSIPVRATGPAQGSNGAENATAEVHVSQTDIASALREAADAIEFTA